MRKFKIIIETGIAGGDFEDEFEVDDDATPDEIHDEAKDIFFNYCNYSYHEIKVTGSFKPSGLFPPALQK
ncbi:hypothetical protein AE740_004939 [Escherichia coli]|uniref:DUF7167 family protein n=1 Tax=Escherichia coli TaxID=562 RepID=UPI001829A1CC|nr:hypothetical protein [Escherichia coli]